METYPQNITTLDGKDVTFQCRALGAPTPDIQWIYNGELSLAASLFLTIPNR
jgi:hypothetical protein